MFDRNFIEKIEEMAEVQTIEKNGVQYSTKKLHQISKPMAGAIAVNSLEAVVAFIKKTKANGKIELPLMVNAKYNTVEVHSSLTENLERDLLLSASPLTPSLGLEKWMSVEEFIINLRTRFEQTEVREQLLNLVSKLYKKDEVELSDNGITQSVVAQTGVTIHEEVTIPPVLKLQPKRAFGEVVQPETLFLFRVNKDARVALFEADGGAWKDEARISTRDYLTDALATEIAEDKVVVIA